MKMIIIYNSFNFLFFFFLFMKLVIASGKGGTGKTTFAVNLALIANNNGVNISLFDCDVEAPNDDIFITMNNYLNIPVYSFLPRINEYECINCGKCSDICKFNSLVYIAKTKKILFFPERCHGCGACVYVCPQNCIENNQKEIGNIYSGVNGKLKFFYGKMKTGEILSPVIIKKMKTYIHNDEITIIDAPPGTSCPVVQTIYNCDLCLLVAEPSPFGLYDLKLAVELLKKLNIKFVVVINKDEKDKTIISDYCKEENIEIVGRIPYSAKAAKLYSEGLPLIIEQEYKTIFNDIYEKIMKRA
jgi:MinD superfamily P-loop ATPase